MPVDEHVEVDGIEIVARRLGEPADVPRRDRAASPTRRNVDDPPRFRVASTCVMLLEPSEALAGSGSSTGSPTPRKPLHAAASASRTIRCLTSANDTVAK